MVRDNEKSLSATFSRYILCARRKKKYEIIFSPYVLADIVGAEMTTTLAQIKLHRELTSLHAVHATNERREKIGRKRIEGERKRERERERERESAGERVKMKEEGREKRRKEEATVKTRPDHCHGLSLSLSLSLSRNFLSPLPIRGRERKIYD